MVGEYVLSGAKAKALAGASVAGVMTVGKALNMVCKFQ
jgi:hypothetical protein